MSLPDEVREAFAQGYMRGLLKVMDAVHTAFRHGWQPAEIEAMLRRMAQTRQTEAEAAAYIEYRGAQEDVHAD